jgi:hypothetical protein
MQCYPLVDECGPRNVPKISHIAAILVDTFEVPHSCDSIDDMEEQRLSEVGMPIDRRENCAVYEKKSSLSIPSIDEWLRLTEKLPLALAMRYMLRSQGAIALIDR